MKKIFFLFILCFFGLISYAQSPNKMSYQAVIRNAGNNLVTSSTIGMRISIIQSTPTGTAVYVETQTPSSNANGLVSIEIGGGTLVSGDFGTIDWGAGPYFIKTETDPSGGTSYSITATTQLLSVPYSFYAERAESADNVPTNVSAFTNDAGYLTSFTEVDGSTTNELQTISRTGTLVTLSNGGGSYTDSINIYTAGTGINITGNTISTTAVSIGDVKYGYQLADHNGWYLLDGRALTLLPVNAQSNASLLGITVNLPNASNRVLMDAGSPGATGGSNTITLSQANLPNVTLNGTAASTGAHTHDVNPSAVVTTMNGDHTHDFMSTVNDQPSSASQGYPGNGHEGIRTTDRQDLVIVSTAINEVVYYNGDHTHTVDVANTTSTSSGTHSHSVTVGTGGSGTAINSTPSFLSVNAFIYLGQ